MRAAWLCLKSLGLVIFFASCTFAGEDAKATLKREAIAAMKRLIERIEKGESLWEDKNYPKDVSRATGLLQTGQASIEIGDYELARKAFVEASAIGETIAQNENIPHMHILGNIAEAQSELGEKRAARDTVLKWAEIADRMVQPDSKIMVWYVIARESSRLLTPREAESILRRFERLVEDRPESGVVRSREELRLELLILRGDFEAAARRLADPERFREDPGVRKRIASDLIYMFLGDSSVYRGERLHWSPSKTAAAIRLIEQEREILLADPDPLGKAMGGDIVGRALAKFGRVDDWLAQLKEIDPTASNTDFTRDSIRGVQVRAYKDLTWLFLDKGDKDGARSAARLLLKIAATYERPDLVVINSVDAIEPLIRVGDLDEAVAAMDRLKKTPNYLDWVQPRHFRLIADAYVARGQNERGDDWDRRGLSFIEKRLQRANAPVADDENPAQAEGRNGSIPYFAADRAESLFRLKEETVGLRSLQELPAEFRDAARGAFAADRVRAGDLSTALELLHAMKDGIAADRAIVNAARAAFASRPNTPRLKP